MAVGTIAPFVLRSRTRAHAVRMRRRDVLTLMGGAAVWTGSARAQSPSMPVIGYLGPESPRLFASRLKAFREGLAESGYVEGRNVAIEYRWVEGRYDRLPAAAAE